MARHQHAGMAQSKKAKLENGATRTDDSDIHYNLIPQLIIDRLGARFTLGEYSHGADDWKKGGVEFILSCFSRFEGHKSRLLYSPSKDDDVAAMMWNICVLAWFQANKPEEFEAALERMR